METEIERRFPGTEASVGQARRFVADLLLGRSMSSWPALLAVSEFASNAIKHARSGFSVRVLIGDQVRIEVTDADRASLRRIPTKLDDETGRGLSLVEAVATRWGTDPRSNGKTVWCTVPARRIHRDRSRGTLPVSRR